MSETNANRKAVYTVIESGDDSRKARWVRVGIAFTNRDGSLNVLLDALPVNSRLHIRDFPPADESEGGIAEGAQPAPKAARHARESAAATAAAAA